MVRYRSRLTKKAIVCTFVKFHVNLLTCFLRFFRLIFEIAGIGLLLASAMTVAPHDSSSERWRKLRECVRVRFESALWVPARTEVIDQRLEDGSVVENVCEREGDSECENGGAHTEGDGQVYEDTVDLETKIGSKQPVA